MSTLTGLATSGRFKIHPQSVLSVLFLSVFVQKSGRRSYVKFKQRFPFPIPAFSGNKTACPWSEACSIGGRKCGQYVAKLWMSKKGIWETDGGYVWYPVWINILGSSKTLSVISELAHDSWQLTLPWWQAPRIPRGHISSKSVDTSCLHVH